jgi:uncharacterized phage protein (TIGR02220 family)
MPFYVGDYLRDTMWLTTEEHGCYCLLLMHYWARGKLTDDIGKLLMITRLPVEKKNALENILATYFQHGDGVYIQKRAEKELVRAKNIQERNINNARKRWNKEAKPIPETCQIGTKPMRNRVPNRCYPQSQSQSQLQSDNIYTDTDSVIDFFNKTTGQTRRKSKTSRKPIHARLSDGFTVVDCKHVILVKYAEWRDNADMQKYITIETFFRPAHFEKYLNQRVTLEKIPLEHKIHVAPMEKLTDDEREAVANKARSLLETLPIKPKEANHG